MRTCQVCGVELVRRDYENDNKFAGRKTCGRNCAGKLNVSKRKTAPVKVCACGTKATRKGQCERCYQRDYKRARAADQRAEKAALAAELRAATPLGPIRDVLTCGDCGQHIGLLEAGSPWRIYDRHNCPRKGKR